MTTTSRLAFLGGQVQPPPRAPGASRAAPAGPDVFVTAKGWLIARPQGESLSVDISNRGTSPIRLSYAMDEYTGQTREGRTVILEKADFLNYPDVIEPGDTRTVLLAAPKETAVADLERLIATLAINRLTLALAAVALPAHAAVDPAARAQTPPERGIRVPESVASTMAPVLAPADATVLVEVEFQQALGSALALVVRWDELAQTATLASGQQQPFYVAPGRHELRVMSELTMLAKTEGRIPLVVSPGEPLRITVDGRATLTGASLRVRVWTQQKLLADYTFGPSTPS